MLVKKDYITIPGKPWYAAEFPTIARLTISSPPANTFTLPFARALLDNILAIEKEAPKVQGLILTSDVPGFFSAGIDLSMFAGAETEWKAFWTTVRAIFRAIYASPLETVAALNGHTLGFGCIMALACDERYILAGKATIGLNEAAVGLPLPVWLGDVFSLTTSPRHAEKLLPVGAALAPADALKVGLVDGVFDDVQSLNQAAVDYLTNRFSRAPYAARTMTLGPLRAGFLKRFDADVDVDGTWNTISVEPVKSLVATAGKALASKRSRM